MSDSTANPITHTPIIHTPIIHHPSPITHLHIHFSSSVIYFYVYFYYSGSIYFVRCASLRLLKVAHTVVISNIKILSFHWDL